MTQRFYALFIAVIAVVILVSPFFLAPVQAQGPQFPGDTGPSGIVPCGDGPVKDQRCTFNDLICLADQVLDFTIYFASTVAVLLFVYAGFLYISAAGDTTKVSKATSIFGNVLIGFILVMVAWLVIDIILKVFVGSGLDSFGPWNRINC